MRELGDVLASMFKEIPESEVEFRGAISWWMNSVGYHAPEQRVNDWNNIGFALQHHLPAPNQLNEWQKRVVNIWMNKNAY